MMHDDVVRLVMAHSKLRTNFTRLIFVAAIGWILATGMTILLLQGGARDAAPAFSAEAR